MLVFSQNLIEIPIGRWAVYPTHSMDFYKELNIALEDPKISHYLDFRSDGKLINSKFDDSYPTFWELIENGNRLQFVYPDFKSYVYINWINNDLIVLAEQPLPPYPIANPVFIRVLKRFEGK